MIKFDKWKVYDAKSKRDWGYAPEYIQMIIDRNNETGYELTQLGTGTLLSVEGFIDHTLRVLNIDFEKTEESGLLSWRTERFTVREQNRDLRDQKRKLKANIEKVNEGFGCVPKICQNELVKTLVKDHLQ